MLLDLLQQRLAEREALSLRRRRRIAESACAPLQQVSPGDGADPSAAAAPARELLAFCSNDYLGLAGHPALAAALAEGAARYGTGSGASHLINGHSRAHQALEDELARWLAPTIPYARVLSFSTGYMANLAVLSALGRLPGGDVTFFCDALNHASLIDGARLARAQVVVVPHADPAALQPLLAGCGTPHRFIVTDGVFSMDGDIAPLPELLALAQHHDAWLVVDDAHGFGVLGPQGRGSAAHFGLRSERLIVMGTLGKAAGVAGAFVAAHETLAEWLLQTARPYIFTTAAPPALAHAVRASLALIGGAEGERRRGHLERLIEHLRTRLPAALQALPGDRCRWRLLPSDTAVQPLLVGDNAAALALAAALEARGLWVPAIRPPTVPQGTARLRIALSAAHSIAQVDRLIEALRDGAREPGP
jgi:8-amino-7-oxononanoate synthase